MRAIIAAAFIVALLCVGIFWVGCVGAQARQQTCVESVEAEPRLSKKESVEACMEILAALTYRDMQCGQTYTVEDLQLVAAFAHNLCEEAEDLYSAKVGECLANIAKKECADFLHVPLDPSCQELHVLP